MEINMGESKEKVSKISKRSRMVAFLLCYIFGMFGAHRFYVGKTHSGEAFIAGSVLPVILTWIAVYKAKTPNTIVWLFLLSGLIALSVFIAWVIDLVTIILGKFKTPKGYVVKKWFED